MEACRGGGVVGEEGANEAPPPSRVCPQKRKRQSSVEPAGATNASSSSSSALPTTNMIALQTVHKNSGDRPCKRRRLGQATILCMRELFRAVVKDGDITTEERLVLQNTALLLSQVDGQTWVSFPDCDGCLDNLSAPQLKHVRPFLDKVAEELREKESSVLSRDGGSNEAIDCLKLSEVPWADGITAEELLRCCQPDPELLHQNKFLERTVLRFPSRYMLRSRMRELINYYHLRWSALPAAKKLEEDRGGYGCALLRPAAERCGRGAAWCLQLSVQPLVLGVAAAACLLVTLVSAMTRALSLVVSLRTWLQRRGGHHSRVEEPFWPAFRFFAAAALHTQSREVAKLLVTIARLRVFVCLSSCNTFFGWLLFPLVVVVEKILKVDRENRLIGCSCFDTEEPSLISWLPVQFSDVLVWLLKLIRFVPLAEFATGPFVRFVDLSHPFLSFICDLVFSLGLAQGLGRVVNLADESAQGRLVWMSMGVARMVREAPKDLAPSLASSPRLMSVQPPNQESLAVPVSTIDPTATEEGTGPTAASTPMDVDVTTWSEDGGWSLF